MNTDPYDAGSRPRDQDGDGLPDTMVTGCTSTLTEDDNDDNDDNDNDMLRWSTHDDPSAWESDWRDNADAFDDDDNNNDNGRQHQLR